jgi:calcium-dependent protein kinase
MSDLVINKQNFIKERTGDINTYYEFGPEMGKGAYGIVYRCVEKETSQVRAIKKINKENIKNEQRFFNELTALKTLDHPHIIKLFEVFEDEENVYLVQEFCSGGELFDQLAEQDHFDETFAAVIFEQILKALWYCHNNKICHRDLKPENFMFSNKEENATLKLIDFGLSRSFFDMTSTGERALLRMETKAGTAFFMAPEVIQGNYSNSCDMWSIGCILYLMLSGYPPFDGESQEEIFESILEGKFDFDDEEWDGVSDEAKDLISQLLINENDRLTAKQALKHPWIKMNLKKSKKKGLS